MERPHYHGHRKRLRERFLKNGVDEAGQHFNTMVGRIRAGEFSVTAPPETAICRECDLRTLCRAGGVIGEIGDSEALAA